MFAYRAYGLEIASALELPELEAGVGPTDITICFGAVERELGELRPNGMRVAVTRDEIGIEFPQVGTILAQRGCILYIDPAPGVDASALRAAILGPALATLLHQRGLLVLHASAVEYEQRAVAFLGGSGGGKSTLAAALHTRGLRLIADDLVPVEFGANGTVQTFPGFPQLKLYPEAARAIEVNPENLPRLVPTSDKRAHRLPGEFQRKALPLGCVYVLDEGDTSQIEALAPAPALIELIRHTFLAGLLQATETSAAHLKQCTQLASRVPVRRVVRTQRLDALGSLVELIQNDLARL